jgi:hypothetical protein
MAIDVDFRGDTEDFTERCKKVERVLYILGIPRKAWLIQPTPSGGRHYYVFFRRAVATRELSQVLELVNLRHVAGQHEIFPSETQGFRLPFGWIPGQTHDPGAWARFIRAYESGEFPRVNWRRCRKRATRWCERQFDKLGAWTSSSTRRESNPTASRQIRPSSPRPIGIPKADQAKLKQTNDEIPSVAMCPKDIEDLLRHGIQAEGTRLDLTKKVAWNFIFVRGMSEEEAAAEIIRWVYETGKHTSKDVRSDLENGTQKVAEQTRQIVAWCAARRRESGATGGRRFSPAEIDTIIQFTSELPETILSSRVHFAIAFLNFAKRHGTRHDDSWACCPSVRGIIRKWKGCSGTRYKAHLDWALKVGLIEMIREKWQPKTGKGRARTYAIHVPHSRVQERTLSYTGAIEYARQRVSAHETHLQAPDCVVNESDTYKKIVLPKEMALFTLARDPDPDSILRGRGIIHQGTSRCFAASRLA